MIGLMTFGKTRLGGTNQIDVLSKIHNAYTIISSDTGLRFQLQSMQ